MSEIGEIEKVVEMTSAHRNFYVRRSPAGGGSDSKRDHYTRQYLTICVAALRRSPAL